MVFTEMQLLHLWSGEFRDVEGRRFLAIFAFHNAPAAVVVWTVLRNEDVPAAKEPAQKSWCNIIIGQDLQQPKGFYQGAKTCQG